MNINEVTELYNATIDSLSDVYTVEKSNKDGDIWFGISFSTPNTKFQLEWEWDQPTHFLIAQKRKDNLGFKFWSNTNIESIVENVKRFDWK